MNVPSSSRPAGSERETNEVGSAMRLLPSQNAPRTWWLELGVLVLVPLAFATALAAERPLTDADIERWLPRLRAEAAAFTKSVQEGTQASAALGVMAAAQARFYADVESGKQDVLAWIRARTDRAIAPAGAIYSAGCSRAITLEGAVPTALFTFGKESPYRELLRRAASGDDSARDELHALRGEEESGGRSAAGRAMREFVAGIASFYRDRGFVDSEGPSVSILTTILVAPDRSVVAWISEVNLHRGLLPRDPIPECATLPTGPLAELRFEAGADPDAAGGYLAEGAAAGDVGGEIGAIPAAQAGGRPDPEYERVKEALFVARSDAANPAQVEVPIPSDGPPEARAEMAALAAQFAVRKASALVYKRREAEIAPILETLLPWSGE